MFPICQQLYTFGVEMDFTRNGDFTWRLPDCEKLVGHLIEYLGRNATNYFMYQRAAPIRSPPTHQSSCISTKPVYRTSSVTYSEMTETHDLGLKSER